MQNIVVSSNRALVKRPRLVVIAAVVCTLMGAVLPAALGGPLPATIEAGFRSPGPTAGVDKMILIGKVSDGTNGNRLGGGNESNQSAAVGDIDGDGFDDLVVGASQYRPDATTDSSVYNNRGQVFVVFGNGSRVNTTGDPINDASPVWRIRGVNQDDQMGNSVAVGDINGDGFDDVIAGAHLADPSGGANAGVVYVVYGSSIRPGTTTDLNPTTGVVSQATVVAGETRILADDASDSSGGAFPAMPLAAGDINGDGFDDIIIGMPGGDPAGGADAGEAYVIYGSATLPGQVIDLNSTIGSNGETRILGDDAGDLLGVSVATGDINGDGYDDVLIGAVGGDPAAGADAGEVYVIYGAPTLPGSTIDLNSAIGSNGETRIHGDDVGERLGWSVAAGDVNGDGYDDVIMGTGANAGSVNNRGQVIIVFGSASKPTCGVPTDCPDVSPGTRIDLNRGSTAVIPTAGIGTQGEARITGRAATANDRTGMHVSAGDVNGDGYADILIGAPNSTQNSRSQAGQAYLVYGPIVSPGLFKDLNASPGDVWITNNQGNVNNAADQLANSGTLSGDLNRDGFAECNVTACRAEPTLARASVGISYTFFGGGNATNATAKRGYKAGNTVSRGIGGRLTPVLRTKLGFTGGTAGSATVTLTRSDSGITGLGAPGFTADALWEISTTKTGFTDATITLQYLDSEITGLTEADLGLWRADAPTGPWTHITSATLDTNRNEVTATVTELGFFALTTLNDTDPPNAISIVPDFNPTDLDDVPFTVTFDEAVTNFNDASDVVIVHTGTASTGVTITGGPTIYTVTVNGVTGNGSFTLAVNTASDVEDQAGNPLDTSVTSVPVVIDNTPIIINFGAPVGSPVRSSGTASYPLTITGADSVNLLSGQVTINHSGTAGGSVTILNGTTTTPTVQITGVTGDGSYTISLAAGVASDVLGGSAPAGPSPQAVTVDNTPPVVLIGAPTGSPTNSAGTASYPVTVTGASSVNLLSGNVSLNHSGTAGGVVTIQNGTSASPTVQVTGVTGDGFYTISIAGGVASDAAGNISGPAGPSAGSVSVDNTPPNAAFIIPATVGPTNATSIAFTVTFDEPVINFESAADVVLTHTGTASVGMTFSGGPLSYIVTVTGISGDGFFTFRVSTVSGVQDAAGNGLGSSVTSATVVIDPNSLSVALTTAAGNPVDGPIPVTATLSRASVNFDAADITTTNATITGFSGIGTVYTFTLNPIAEGLFEAFVEEGKFTDTAGNLNIASNFLIRTYDNTAPVFSNVVANPPAASAGDRVEISFESSEDIGGDPDVTVNGRTASRLAKAAFTYEYTVTYQDPLGPATIVISGVDLAGNAGMLTNTDALTIEDPGLPLTAWPAIAMLALAGMAALRRRNK